MTERDTIARAQAQDADHHGIGIMQGGKRIAPEDFYAQPDADDREALVDVISKALWDAKSSSKTTVNYLTDALLADGWRKPTGVMEDEA